MLKEDDWYANLLRRFKIQYWNVTDRRTDRRMHGWTKLLYQISALLCSRTINSNKCCSLFTWNAYRNRWPIQGGGEVMAWTPPGLIVNFWIIFALFCKLLSWLDRKIRVPRLLVTVGVFCQLKTASKCTQTLGTKMISPQTTPHPLDAYGASPLPYWNPKQPLIGIQFSKRLSV